MSTLPNAYGNFLSNLSPFIANYASFGGPNGTFVKPGGRVAAYVRSTGAQDGDDQFASSGLLVSTINEGLKRCRSGMNDIVYVLPGHTETYSASGAVWANLVAGAQIVSAGVPGMTSNPTITLSNVGASIALNVADVSLIGFNIRSSAVLTAGIVVTGAGCVLAGNSVISTGTLAANSLIQVTGAANFQMMGNNVVADSTTGAIVNATLVGTTNMAIIANLIRQAQGTSGGIGINVANAALTGFIANNYIMTATNLGSGNIGTLITIGSAALPGVGTFENYGSDAAGGNGIIVPDANTDA